MVTIVGKKSPVKCQLTITSSTLTNQFWTWKAFKESHYQYIFSLLRDILIELEYKLWDFAVLYMEKSLDSINDLNHSKCIKESNQMQTSLICTLSALIFPPQHSVLSTAPTQQLCRSSPQYTTELYVKKFLDIPIHKHI